MATKGEIINWMILTHLLSIFPLTLMKPFLYIYLYFKIHNNLFQTYTLEKNNTSPLRILCMLMRQLMSLSTRTLVCTWYEESTMWDY